MELTNQQSLSNFIMYDYLSYGFFLLSTMVVFFLQIAIIQVDNEHMFLLSQNSISFNFLHIEIGFCCYLYENQMKQQRQQVRSVSWLNTDHCKPASSQTLKRMNIAAVKTQLLTSIYNVREKPVRGRNEKKMAASSSRVPSRWSQSRTGGEKGIKKCQQQLYEQNMKLKQQLNKYSDQLSIIKGRIKKSDTQSKKYIRNKQLDMEFQKEIYWSGSRNHMIVGVKYQYEKVKQQYQSLMNQYNQLKTTVIKSKQPQSRIYLSQLERQNKRLATKLSQLLSRNQKRVYRQSDGKQIQLFQYQSLAAQNQNKKLKQHQLILQQQLKTKNETIVEKDRKIQFIQKLLIQKNNKQYHDNKRIKKLHKQSQQLRLLMNKRQKEILKQTKDNQAKLKQLEHDHLQEKTILETKTKSLFNQKDQYIRSLQSENKKLEEDIAELKMSNIHQIYKKQESFHGSVLGRSHRKDLIKSNRQATVSNVNKGIDQQQKAQQSGQISDYSCQGKVRVMKTAQKRHSKNAKKARKVQFNQVQQLGEMLRYRLINQQIAWEEIKEYFSYRQKNSHKSDASNVNQQEESSAENQQNQHQNQNKQLQWNCKYISMAETQKILQNYPFNLEVDQAFLFARYIIEDCYEDYVYCDGLNENVRDVVKSIVNAVIGQYKKPSSLMKVEAKEFLVSHRQYLSAALRSSCTGGKVRKSTFLDILSHLEISMSQSVQQILLAKLAARSKNLQQLEYNVLFVNAGNAK